MKLSDKNQRRLSNGLYILSAILIFAVLAILGMNMLVDRLHPCPGRYVYTNNPPSLAYQPGVTNCAGDVYSPDYATIVHVGYMPSLRIWLGTVLLSLLPSGIFLRWVFKNGGPT